MSPVCVWSKPEAFVSFSQAVFLPRSFGGQTEFAGANLDFVFVEEISFEKFPKSTSTNEA